MVDIHENGWTAKIKDHTLRTTVQKTMFCTFQDRSNGLVDVLKVRTCISPYINGC